MTAELGDFIIRVSEGEFHVCKPERFLASHDLAETPRDRMEIESRELNERLSKLKAFVDDDEKFNGSDLTVDEKSLLMIQYGDMLSYAHILDMRIRAMNKKMLLGGSPR